MKKLLVVLMAAVMVFSVAVVSMAAVTVKGDWRAEWIQQDSVSKDLDFSKYDLRFNIDGDVSDSVKAHIQFAFDGANDTPTIKNKEYWVNFNQAWGSVRAGAWDAKYIPSRVLLKPHGVNCMNNKAMQVLIDVPFGDAFYGGLLFDPSLAKDDTEYDVKLGYKADSFGVEVHYADANPAKKDATYTAIDAYYNVTDSVKVFVYGIQAGDDVKKWEEDFAPVVGATFKNIGGSKLTASLEYGLCDGDTNDATDFTPYAVQLKYGFNNKLNLEIEYTNEWDSTANDTEGKLIIRPRVSF